jgi:hypothetical protein
MEFRVFTKLVRKSRSDEVSVMGLGCHDIPNHIFAPYGPVLSAKFFCFHGQNQAMVEFVTKPLQ